MSFDNKVEKPLFNSNLISTSNLQKKSQRSHKLERKTATPNLQTRTKLSHRLLRRKTTEPAVTVGQQYPARIRRGNLRSLRQYGHNLNNIALASQAPIQTKLTIGQPGDKYEREADNVSDRVMNMSEPVQRQEIAEEQVQTKPEIQPQEIAEEEEVQTKPLANTITPLVQRQEIPEEEEQVQTKPEIQPQEIAEEEEQVQAKADDSLNAEGLEQQLSNSKGGGTPLSDEARSFMEPRFGTDFSDVKVHTDSSAVQMNQDIQAQAFTHGQDIYFNSGKYTPDTNEGKSLLAHELTHVVQQRGGE